LRDECRADECAIGPVRVRSHSASCCEAAKLPMNPCSRLVEQHGVKGFKFHPTVQGFLSADKMAWPVHEVINEHKLPAIFHSDHSGI
jgi:hypothetical protein